ncbi:MAG: hypothetical protein ACFE9Z_13425 [Promethearchaeota archaeon]
MTPEDLLKKECADCGKLVSYSKFLNDNPNFSEIRAKELWNDPMISIFCPDCYFNLPEKPFKVKRGYFNYQGKFRK